MKITINGNPKELAELAKVLGGMENGTKNADFPPLLTELAENKNTNLFFGDAHGQTGDEIAETIRRNRETISVIKKMNEFAKQRKENAPQAETAEQEVPFLVRDFDDRGHRKRIKQTSCGSEDHMNDSE